MRLIKIKEIPFTSVELYEFIKEQADYQANCGEYLDLDMHIPDAINYVSKIDNALCRNKVGFNLNPKYQAKLYVEMESKPLDYFEGKFEYAFKAFYVESERKGEIYKVII